MSSQSSIIEPNSSVKVGTEFAQEPPNYIKRRAIALAVGLAAVFGGGFLANKLTSGGAETEPKPGTIEVSNDTNSERGAVEASTVSYGKLTINPGTKVRHTPNIQNPDESSTGDFQENVASNQVALSIENPIVYVNPLDNQSYYGFTTEGNDGKLGLYWVSTETGGQFDKQGIPYTLFEPNKSMQNAMSPGLEPMLITVDGGQFLSIPDKSGMLPVAQAVLIQP